MDTNELLGRIFDRRYRINELIGSGGMGAVYRATQLGMNREVALKVLGRGVADSDKQAHRFKQEAHASSRLQHPNTIRVFDSGQTEDGRLFLAMEYLKGDTLTEVLKRGKTLSIDRAGHIVRQICKSLAEAHQNGIVHRDLKPDNIFITDIFGEQDFVKVLDFGIAKSSDSEEMASLTQTGFICGTPRYLSPEQALGRPVDGRSDLYSLGVILYEVLTGAPPFMAATPIALVMKHIHEAAPDVELDESERGEWMSALIGCLLNKEPNRRPTSAAVVSDAVEAIMSNRQPEILSSEFLTGGSGRTPAPISGGVRTLDFRSSAASSPALATQHEAILSTHETILLDTQGLVPAFEATSDAPMARETFEHDVSSMHSDQAEQPTAIADLGLLPDRADVDGVVQSIEAGGAVEVDNQNEVTGETGAVPSPKARLPSTRSPGPKRRSASTTGYRSGRKRRAPSTVTSQAQVLLTESGEHLMTQAFPEPDVLAMDEELAQKALGAGRWQSYLLAGGIALMLCTIVLMIWTGGSEKKSVTPEDSVDKNAPLSRDVPKASTGAKTTSVPLEAASEKTAAETVAAETVATEKIATETVATETVAAETVAAEKVAAEKVAAEKVAAEKATTEKAATEKAAAETVSAEKVSTETVATEKVAAEKAATEKAATEKAAAEKVSAEKVSAEKVSTEKVSTEKVSTEKVAAEKVAAEKVSAEKVSAEKVSAEKAAATETVVSPPKKTSKPKRASTKVKKKTPVRAKKKRPSKAKRKKKRPRKKVIIDIF